jgi:tetratricopeptide (TPR) repeat protein
MEYGNVLNCRGDFDDAIPLLEAVLQAAREADAVAWTIAASGLLGYALAMAGRLPEGIALLREGFEQATRSRRTKEASFAAYLGHALLREGHLEEARRFAARALSVSRERGERGSEARSLCLLGEVEAHGAGDGKGRQAERHYAEALALAEELGMRPLVAHCHLGLGKLSRQTGKLEQARDHLATAATMYREMDMRFWLGQAEAESKELR